MALENIIEKLQERNSLTIIDDKICIKPLNQYEYITCPIDVEDCIQITEEEYIGILTRVYMFNEELNGVVDFVAPVIEEAEDEGEVQVL